MASVSLPDLRSRLAIALATELGDYQFSDGTTRTALEVFTGAIAVDGDGEPIALPQVVASASGGTVECVIEPDVEDEFTPLLGQDYERFRATRISLKQWTISKTVQTASSLLISELKDCLSEVEPRVRRVAAIDNVESQAFFIRVNGV